MKSSILFIPIIFLLFGCSTVQNYKNCIKDAECREAVVADVKSAQKEMSGVVSAVAPVAAAAGMPWLPIAVQGSILAILGGFALHRQSKKFESKFKSVPQ